MLNLPISVTRSATSTTYKCAFPRPQTISLNPLKSALVVTDVALTEEQRQKIQNLITQVSQQLGTDTWQARTLIHKHICGGKCNWYKAHSKEAGFNRTTLTPKQKTLITETINKTMKDTPIKEAEAQIHKYLCPGHPRPTE